MKYRLSRLFALLLVFALVVNLIGCSAGKGAVPPADVRTISGKITERPSTVRNKTLHVIRPGSLGTPMATSGLMQLYLDDNSFGIALFEKTREKYWYALPTASPTHYDASAATVSMDVLSGNTMYKLNSQDDAVYYGNVACDTFGENEVSGLNVTYVFTPDDTTAHKVSEEKLFNNSLSAADFAQKDIVILVRVTYELRDGNLYVSAAWKNLSGNPDAVVCNLSVLPFFGASIQGESGDYFLLPDGCGSLMRTDVQDPSFQPIELKVYGADPCVDESSDSKTALFPAYAAKQGDNAYAVIIEQGDALTTICANRGGAHGFNTVGPRFAVTPLSTAQKDGKDVTYVSRNSYTEPVRLCVRLLGGAHAGLDGIAVACREQFMRMGYLSTDMQQSEEYLPFQMNILGAVSGDKLGFPQVLTTFDEAQDLLTRMKSKGVNNVDVRYLGALSGGTNSEYAGRLRLAFRLGGKKDLQRLADFVTAQGHSLYLDTSLLSVRADGSLSAGAALNIRSDTAETECVVGDRVYSRKLLQSASIEKNIIRLLTDAQSVMSDGFCISDVSSLLYSDYAQGYTGRTQSMELIRENLPALSTDRLLMVDTGYFYALRYADFVSGLPQTTGYPERNKVYSCVPFVQMILHGTLDYSGTPVNLAENRTIALLRSVEYGCCPSYTWCFDRSGGDKLCYEDQLNDAVAFYQKANESLADLRDARIVGNGVAASGVRFTKYDTGAVIYINYTEQEVTVGDIRLDALSFLRIG